VTAEDRKALKEISDSIDGLKTAFTHHRAIIDTTLRNYPELSKQVNDNKQDISNIWTVGRVVTTLLTMGLLIVGTIAAIP